MKIPDFESKTAIALWLLGGFKEAMRDYQTYAMLQNQLNREDF